GQHSAFIGTALSAEVVDTSFQIFAAFTRYNFSVLSNFGKLILIVNFSHIACDLSQTSQHTAILIEQESLILDNLSRNIGTNSGAVKYLSCGSVIVCRQLVRFSLSVVLILFSI